MGNLKNFATGTILVAPSPATSGTSLQVQSGEGAIFPAAPFYATVWPDNTLPTLSNAEVVLVTAKSTDTFTITRAQKEPTAKSIAVNWRISNAIFAEDLMNGSMVYNEVPGGSVDGSNTAFTIAGTGKVTGSLIVYRNGIRLKNGGADFTETSGGFTMTTAPATNAVLLCEYRVGSTSDYSVGSNSTVVGEVPSGSVNGSNAVFTTARPYIAGTVDIKVNGLSQARTTHFTETTPASGTITLGDAPASGDVITVDYQYNLNPSSNADTVDGNHADDLSPIGMPVPFAGRFVPSANWLMCYGQAVSRTTYSILFGRLNPVIGTFTITIASPGVLTLTAHGMFTGEPVYLTTTGALPTGISANTIYYVIVIDANTLRLATSEANAVAGTAINTSGSQSGTHTLRFCPWGLGDGSTTFNVPDMRGRTWAGWDAMGGTSANRLTGPSTTGSVNGDIFGKTGGEEAHTQLSAELAAHTHTVRPSGSDNNMVAGGAGGSAANLQQSGAAFRVYNSPITSSTGSSTPFNVVQPTGVGNWMIRAL